jgi:cyanophycinase-like exopeptidase
MSRLVVMGSGETAPTMVRTHRRVFAATGDGPAVLLDTPFGFQMNADELVARTVAYFGDSVGRRVDVARWRSADASTVERETALAALHGAVWAFAGPGSPTYALRQWIGTPVPEALVDVARRGGTLVLGSAAAVTLGTHAIPVYEIYKVGEEPRWVDGLDLLGRLTGIKAAVIPHYDNAEGGTHDTRFCYLGEQRLSRLESDLPADVGVLGVDEHTALIVDLDTGQADVTGNGAVTIRRRGASRVVEPGTTLTVDELAAALRGDATAGGGASGAATPVRQPEAAEEQPQQAEQSLRAEADRAAAAFDAALAARDVDACVAAVLDLEAAIVAWRADTLQSDDTDHARRVLRALVVRLGDLARVGARDPREAVEPYVSLLLELRAAARAARDFATSDLVRDGLAAAGVEVRDTPDGVDWLLR